MSFLTGTGESAALSIPHPFLGVSDLEIKDAMQRILSSNAMTARNSLLAAKIGAELITVTEKQFNL